MPPQGVETPSESVMLSMTDPEAGVHFTARLCRYPAHRTAWLWTHTQTPDGFFAFVNHAAPCGADETPGEGAQASYADAAGALRFTREGATTTPRSAHLVARVVRAQGGNLTAEMAFTPTLIRAGLLPGRMEAFGPVEGDLCIGGRTLHVRGMGQFHEQRQTEARFTTPFSFATLWGEDVASTLLQIPTDSGGYVLRQGEQARPGRVRIAPPGEERSLRIDFGPGDFLEGRATVVTRYTIPIYGQSWFGSFVTAELGGARFYGALNDWRPDALFGAN